MLQLQLSTNGSFKAKGLTFFRRGLVKSSTFVENGKQSVETWQAHSGSGRALILADVSNLNTIQTGDMGHNTSLSDISHLWFHKRLMFGCTFLSRTISPLLCKQTLDQTTSSAGCACKENYPTTEPGQLQNCQDAKTPLQALGQTDTRQTQQTEVW